MTNLSICDRATAPAADTAALPAAEPAQDLEHCDDLTYGGNLAQWGDGELLSLVRSLPLGDQRRAAACEVLVTRYQPLVRSCARKYWNGPESADELMQLGYVGLMKAINKFDPEVGGSLAAFPSVSGEEDGQVEHALDMAAVSAHWKELHERQQRILLLRFYGNKTQAEIGETLGISQMHVSRLLTESLSYLRECLLGPEKQLTIVGGP
jgi:DNA-directed RNA polymerase specialized sigma subunit